MRLQAINVGRPRTVDMGAGPEDTAIFKTTIDGPVGITAEGVDGDTVGDTKHHGGPDQAVYVYFDADYRHWEKLLGRSLEPGVFGENLTISGDGDGSAQVSSKDLFVGDRLKVGSVVLEVTACRIPCGTFARRLELPPSFIERFRRERRPGVYTRVLEPGVTGVGDHVRLIEGARTVSVIELLELWGKQPDAATIDRILEAPIAERARADYERKRAKVRA